MNLHIRTTFVVTYFVCVCGIWQSNFMWSMYAEFGRCFDSKRRKKKRPIIINEFSKWPTVASGLCLRCANVLHKSYLFLILLRIPYNKIIYGQIIWQHFWYFITKNMHIIFDGKGRAHSVINVSHVARTTYYMN